MTQGTIDTGTDHLLANLNAGVLTLTLIARRHVMPCPVIYFRHLVLSLAMQR